MYFPTPLGAQLCFHLTFVATTCAFLFAGCGTPAPLIAVNAPATQPVGETNIPEASPPSPENASAEKVWLSPIHVSGRVFFFDELTVLSNTLADILPSLAEASFSVIPPGQLVAVVQEIRRGRLPGTDRTCEAPPIPSKLFDYLHPDAGLVKTWIACDDGCDITVDVFGQVTTDENDLSVREQRLHFTGPLSANGSLSDWQNELLGGALKQVPPPTPSNEFGILGIFNNPAPGEYALELGDVVTQGPFQPPFNAELLNPRAEDFYNCKQNRPPARDAWLQPFVLEISEKGAVARCESKLRAQLDPPFFQCQCDVLRSMNFGIARGTRRVEFLLRIIEGPESNNAPSNPEVWADYQLTSDDESVFLSEEPINRNDLAVCAPNIPDNATWNYQISMTVGADAGVVSVQVQAVDIAPASVVPCIKNWLSRSTFSCPLSGAASVNGTVSMKLVH